MKRRLCVNNMCPSHFHMLVQTHIHTYPPPPPHTHRNKHTCAHPHPPTGIHPLTPTYIIYWLLIIWCLLNTLFCTLDGFYELLQGSHHVSVQGHLRTQRKSIVDRLHSLQGAHLLDWRLSRSHITMKVIQ